MPGIAGPLHHIHTVPTVGEPPHPGLILLHGRGTDEHDLISIGPEIDPRLFTVSVRAPHRFPWGGFAWYEPEANQIGFPEQSTLDESIQALGTLLPTIPDLYPIARDRLYIGGFSMGSVMAGTVTLLEPEHIAGTIMMSGYLPLMSGLPFRPDGLGHTPVFQAHGTLDPVIPIAFGRQARDFWTSTPAQLTYHEYPIGHAVSAQEIGDIRDWIKPLLDGGVE